MPITGTPSPGDDILVGTDDPDVIEGLGGNDKIFGGAGDDVLDGGDGNDLIDGGTGADAMTGGAGNDAFYVDNPGDIVIEAPASGADIVFSSIDYTLPDNVERLAALSPAGTAPLNFTGNALNNEISGNDGANIIDGLGGADVLSGGAGDDTYIVHDTLDTIHEHSGGGYDKVLVDLATGNTLHSGFDYSIQQQEGTGFTTFTRGRSSLEEVAVLDRSTTNSVNLKGNYNDNVIRGNDGINVLEGMGGNDTMHGYKGDDIYFVGEAGDTVIEAAGEGYDTVFIGRYYPQQNREPASPEPLGNSYTLPDNVERLIQARTVSMTLVGNALDNEITDNSTSGTLDGKEGNDVLTGNAGADTFRFSTALGPGNVDRIRDFAPGTDKIALDNAIFTDLPTGVLAGDAFTYGTQAQDAGDRIIFDDVTGNLYYDADGTGTAANPILFATLNFNRPPLSATDFTVVGTDAPGTDDTLIGTDGVDRLSGGGGNDRLFGGFGDDILDGGEGDDLIDGGPGADAMTGRAGNDVFYVDNAGDVVVESASDGTDLVFSSIDYTLAPNVERLAALDPQGTSALNFTGNALSNEISGSDGPNVIDGGAGSDLMKGWGGDDIYIADSDADGFGEHAGGGFDRVRFSGVTNTNVLHANFDFTLGSFQLNIVPVVAAVNYVEQIEVFDPTSTYSVNLRGSLQDDIIKGNNGINMLEGHLGNDTLVGYGGDDYYFVGEAGDVVVEAAGEGYDTVYLGRYYNNVTVAGAIITSYTLPDNVERGVGTLGGIVTLSGNALDNELSGNDLANTLNGRDGHDILIGYGGADRFVFDSPLTPDNWDSIADFTPGTDTIVLDNSVFTGLQAGELSADAFTYGTQAQDANDRIIYDSVNGDLYFDADGSGAASDAVLFAHLYRNLTNLAASDFNVIEAPSATSQAAAGDWAAALSDMAASMHGLGDAPTERLGVDGIDRLIDHYAPLGATGAGDRSFETAGFGEPGLHLNPAMADGWPAHAATPLDSSALWMA